MRNGFHVACGKGMELTKSHREEKKKKIKKGEIGGFYTRWGGLSRA